MMPIPGAAAAALSSAPASALPVQPAAAPPVASSPAASQAATATAATATAATATAAAAIASVPEALQAPQAGPEVDTKTPWAQVGYVGWMNGTPREKSPIFDTKFFTPEIRFDMNYLQSLNHPRTTPSSAPPRNSAPANSRSNK